MFYIKTNYEYKYEIKHSKFIALAFPINDSKDISLLLDKIKLEYQKASHYPYGYKVNNSQGYSDDGEPSQTSGKMILDIINLNQLNNILIVIPRYFGGIKLGKPLLTRTYYNCANNLCNLLDLFTKVKKYHYIIKIPFQNKIKFLALFKNYIINANYLDEITFEIYIDNQEMVENNTYLFTKYDYLGLKEILIERNKNE